MQAAARPVSALVIRRRHDGGHDDRQRHGRALALPPGVGCALMGYGIPFRGAFSAYISKEALMRIPALAILTIATVLTAAPVRAQTYDPAYPVCLHVYQWGGVPLLRLQLHVAASVQRVGIGPRRHVRHQSIFCWRGRAQRGLSASPRLLKAYDNLTP